MNKTLTKIRDGRVSAAETSASGGTAEIENRFDFEALIENISARMASIDWDVGADLDEILRQVGAFLAADRVSYIDVGAETNSLTPIRHWFAEGVEPDYSVQNVDVSARFKWLSTVIAAGEPVAVRNLDELPDSASNERQYCEQMGIQAFAMVPATIGGQVVAVLALDSIREPGNWNEAALQRIKLIAALIAGAVHHMAADRDLVKLRKFENAVFEISTRFINLPAEQIDAEIEAGLGAVANALDVHLITLLQVSGASDFEVTHEWSCEQIIERQFKGTQVASKFPWLAARLREGEVLAISKVSDFPLDAKNEMAAMKTAGLASVLWVPFEVRGNLAGYLAIDNIDQTKWSDNLTPELRLLGELFGEAIIRKHTEFELRGSLKEIESLKTQLQEENKYLRRGAKLDFEHGDIVGDSQSLRSALKKAEQVAPTDSTVLILGETGTGKELLARSIHRLSPRHDRLMITINCAALPSSLVEAELFGREKGAYTGALTREAGRFEIANGSTILLDEIGELPLDLQAKLLRVLEEGEFERLGSSKTLKTDVRLLASTNRDLAAAVEGKTFREDLFYRLNVFPIVVPPLRDRTDDIPKLVWAFVQEFSESMGKNIESIPAHTMDSLMAYTWPGNVREVRNIVERAMILSQGPILEIDLPGKAVEGTAASSRQLADVERTHIQAVIESTAWRIRGSGGAAEILGLKPTTLEARMKKLGLRRPNTR